VATNSDFLYPLKFRPKIKKMIWGSESWDISCRPNEMSMIENGACKGLSFEDFIKKDPVAVLGSRLAEPLENLENTRFPLLVKIIDARATLSVQVHPGDEYARLKSDKSHPSDAADSRITDCGKSEMWYILNPPTEGFLYLGLKQGVTHPILEKASKDGTIEELLNRLHVRAGDIVNIPAGTVHALTLGTVVVEIQQNSDITYRLYDFGRLDAEGNPRPLHVKDALAVTKFCTGESDVLSPEHFTVEKLTLSAPLSVNSDPEIFSVYTCTEDSVIFKTPDYAVELCAGSSIFIPARLGVFTIKPTKTAVLLKTEPICPPPHIIKQRNRP